MLEPVFTYEKIKHINSFEVHYHFGLVVFKIILILKNKEHHKSNIEMKNDFLK